MLQAQPRALILGTRGVPAAHGGFESFAEKLSVFLVERGWRATVYCQHDVAAVTQRFSVDTWRGIERINVQVDRTGALGTIAFDWHSIRHAAGQDGVCLVLGYNTAVLLAPLRAASDEVMFPGAIYDKTTVQALRFHARAYCHGHMVGGTNPSLVEALWCGNAVLAHRNRFNVWTAGAEQFFFSDIAECERLIERILTDDLAVARARAAARLRAATDFNWPDILLAYDSELAALG